MDLEYVYKGPFRLREHALGGTLDRIPLEHRKQAVEHLLPARECIETVIPLVRELPTIQRVK